MLSNDMHIRTGENVDNLEVFFFYSSQTLCPIHTKISLVNYWFNVILTSENIVILLSLEDMDQ